MKTERLRIFLAEDNLADVLLIEEALKRQVLTFELDHYSTAEQAVNAAQNCRETSPPWISVKSRVGACQIQPVFCISSCIPLSGNTLCFTYFVVVMWDTLGILQMLGASINVAVRPASTCHSMWQWNS